MLPKRFLALIAAALFLAVAAAPKHALASLLQNLIPTELPAAPVSLDGAAVAKLGNRYVVVSPQDGSVHVLDTGATAWSQIGVVESVPSHAGVASDATSLILLGGRDSSGTPSAKVVRISLQGTTLSTSTLPDLPTPTLDPAVLVRGNTLYLVGGHPDQSPDSATNQFLSLDLVKTDAQWQSLAPFPGQGRFGGQLVHAIESTFYIGAFDATGALAPTLSFHALYGWRQHQTPPSFTGRASLAATGDAHALVFVTATPEHPATAYLYHTIGDSWIETAQYPEIKDPFARLAGGGNEMAAIAQDQSLTLKFADPITNYAWWDHLAVALYFAIMIYVGFYFTKQSRTTQSYFRGSNRIPWWATGMSLFATGASALSLLSMPGKSYSTNWTFFSISIYSALFLPLSMYFLAPLVRKLNFATAFGYLEERFGTSVRMFGSAIFVVQQILGRMGPVMLLPAIAMHAITGIDVRYCIVAMGIVTTLYTFLGGLAAVIWTDTIQGFVMILAVFGCLVLVYLRIDMPNSEMWSVLSSGDKMHMFDWGASLTESNVLTIALGILAITLFGISDQNYVQRVQCTPTLKDAKKAIATQMAVAVPINLILFGLGTALFLFYRENPGELNPIMKNDGIFPFFAAQQLPPGVSGLVVAALLAATMSTISSAICSVSNLGVDDFFRRFRKSTTDHEAVVMGRILTVIVGLLGIAAALFLSEFKTPSIWDLALKVISFITSATLGIFTLGLLTRRANEIGVLVGIAAGMASTWYLQQHTAFSFWLYPISGALVTHWVGYAVSLATGGNRKPIDGLTVYTLRNRRGGLDG